MMLNIRQIYRFKDIAYGHQVYSSNPFVYSSKNKAKCYDKPRHEVSKCVKKWDKFKQN